MIAVGIDPDLHNTGIAVVESPARGGKFTILEAHIAKVDREYTSLHAVLDSIKGIHKWSCHTTHKPDIVVIEGQEIYAGKTKNPESILRLAQVAGAAVGISQTIEHRYLPRPKEWKGSVPKNIHQERIRAQIANLDPVTCWRPKSAHSHLWDAVGLAIWGINRIMAV